MITSLFCQIMYYNLISSFLNYVKYYSYPLNFLKLFSSHILILKFAIEWRNIIEHKRKWHLHVRYNVCCIWSVGTCKTGVKTCTQQNILQLTKQFSGVIIPRESLVFSTVRTFKCFNSAYFPSPFFLCWLCGSIWFSFCATIWAHWFVHPAKKWPWRQRTLNFARKN